MGKNMEKAALCLGLFDDMTKAYYGLYENESKYDQYSVSVFFISEGTKVLFSTEEIITSINDVEKESIECYFGEHFDSAIEDLQRNRLDPFPKMYLINNYTIDNETDVESFINQYYPQKTKKNKCYEMHTTKGGMIKVYVYIQVNDAIVVPKTVNHVAQKIYQAWSYYFLHLNDNETYVPICRINNLIESSFREEKQYFPVITEISSKYYEKKRCSGKIIITEENERDNILIPLTGFHFTCEEARMLRKLVEMTNVDLAVLVDSKEEIYGIGKESNVKDIKAKFRIINHLEWEMYADNNEEVPILKFKYGRYYLPYHTDVEGSYIIRKTNNMPDAPKKLVYDIIKSLRSKGHGALVIISNEAKEEVERLCKYKCGVATERRNISSGDSDSEKILSALTSVDGAVFLDEEGFCYGFGMILDGDTFIAGSPDRGSRLNSARRYIARKKKDEKDACAIIISDDGYVNIISGYDMGVGEDGSIYDKKN